MTIILLEKPPSSKAQASVWRFRSLLTASILTLCSVSTGAAQVWQTPYAPGSAADLTLRFENGASGAGRSPDIPYIGALNVDTVTPGIGSGGGWDLTGIGTATIGISSSLGGSTHTQTLAGGGLLAFQMDSSGVSQLLSLSLGSQWQSSATIAGSDSWDAPTSSFRYTFDLNLNNSVLGLSPAVFGGIGLTVQAGGNTLYQGALTSILPTLVPIATGVSIEFDYNPADGPLTLVWNGSSVINTTLLSALGDGSSTIFQVGNGHIEVDAIPEPGTYALLAASLAALLCYPRRRRP